MDFSFMFVSIGVVFAVCFFLTVFFLGKTFQEFLEFWSGDIGPFVLLFILAYILVVFLIRR